MEQTAYYLRPTGKGIKLHLGCGDFWMEGFLNIDHAILGGTDMILDLKEKLPFQDSVVEEIQCHDFIEHFTPEEINKMLNDWYRVLIPGGKVIATLPDLEGLAEKYPNDPERFTQAIYGIEKDHKWGYSALTLINLFCQHDFNASVTHVVTSKDEFPRLRVEANK